MPATPKTTRKRFGQHFLTDQAVVERIFAALALRDGDRVLEIGPGTGVLTERLAAEVGTLTAVEIDHDLAAALCRRLPKVRFIRDDALRVDYDRLFSEDPARHRVVGNLPYNIATPLLARLFNVAQVADMHFMLQEEVAVRLTAKPGSKAYGRLTVAGQYHCRVERLFDVAAESFAPPPKVASAFVRLTPKSPEPCDLGILHEVLHMAFGQRRKVLANALRSLAIDWPALAIDPRSRAEQLSVRDFVAITNHCANREERP